MPQLGRADNERSSLEGEGKVLTFNSPEEMAAFLQDEMQEGVEYTLSFPQVTAELYTRTWKRQTTPYLDRVIGAIAQRFAKKNEVEMTDLDTSMDNPTKNTLVFSFTFKPWSQAGLR